MASEPMKAFQAFSALADDALLQETERLAAQERWTTAELIAALVEIDARRLYRQEGCSSTSMYCRRVLGLSEHATYDRVNAARKARHFPVILDRLAAGTLTLSNLTLISPLLEADTCEELLHAVENKSKHEVEAIVAARRAQVVTPEFYHLQLMISREAWQHLQRLQELLLPSIGDGDPSRIVERALALLLVDVEKRKMAKVEHPRPTNEASSGSRHIPAGLRREVGERDGWSCAFVGAKGRCGETRNLEVHHVKPFAIGGATTLENLEMRCRTHNQYEAEVAFGARAVRGTRPGASSTRVGRQIPGQNANPGRPPTAAPALAETQAKPQTDESSLTTKGTQQPDVGAAPGATTDPVVGAPFGEHAELDTS